MKMAYFVNTKESVVLISDVPDEDSVEIRGGDVLDIDTIVGLQDSRQWKKFVKLGIMKQISEDQKNNLENAAATAEEGVSGSESEPNHKDAILIDLTEELKDLHGHDDDDGVIAIVAEAGSDGETDPREALMEKSADNSPRHDFSSKQNMKSSDVAPTKATYANIDDDQVGGGTKAEKGELTKHAEESEQVFVELEEVKDNSH